jgi:hypothetical protein
VCLLDDVDARSKIFVLRISQSFFRFNASLRGIRCDDTRDSNESNKESFSDIVLCCDDLLAPLSYCIPRLASSAARHTGTEGALVHDARFQTGPEFVIPFCFVWRVVWDWSLGG